MNIGHQDEEGFTVVEVVVTLVITSLFLGFFFQMYLMSESQRVKVARQATASNVAYANLRKVATRADVEATIPCDSTTTGSGNQNNLALNANAAGSVFTGYTPESNAGFNQSIRVFYPQGCGLNMPVKLESVVTYDEPLETIVHASYVN